MTTAAQYLAEIDKHLQLKFIDIQSFEKKARAEKGFLKAWEETKIKDTVREIKYFNFLISELKYYQSQSISASPAKAKAVSDWNAKIDEMEAEFNTKIEKALERKYEAFRKSDSVLKILNEPTDFRDDILKRLCKEMDEFLRKFDQLTTAQKAGFESKQMTLNTLGEFVKLLNIYRRLRNEK